MGFSHPGTEERKQPQSPIVDPSDMSSNDEDEITLRVKVRSVRLEVIVVSPDSESKSADKTPISSRTRTGRKRRDRWSIRVSEGDIDWDQSCMPRAPKKERERTTTWPSYTGLLKFLLIIGKQ